MLFIFRQKWEATISRPEIQKFVGALEGQKAKRVFLSQPLISLKKQKIISLR